MMFCDKCDRGYHTFCVGMDSIPTGEGMNNVFIKAVQQTIKKQIKHDNTRLFVCFLVVHHSLCLPGLWVCEVCDKDFSTPKKKGGAKTPKKATSAKK